MVPVYVGQTIIRLDGLEFNTQVIFAEPDEPSLLGKVTLEATALTLDPATGRLITQNTPAGRTGTTSGTTHTATSAPAVTENPSSRTTRAR